MSEGHKNREFPAEPRVAVGALVVESGKLLMICRGKAPNPGVWAIPGGGLEIAETLQQAAEREVFEETGLKVRAGEPFYAFEIIEKDDEGRVRFHYVVIDLKADLLGGELCPGDDAEDVGWVSTAEMAKLNVSPHTIELIRKKWEALGLDPPPF
jgi:ADP-ribose pyrophosphatase